MKRIFQKIYTSLRPEITPSLNIKRAKSLVIKKKPPAKTTIRPKVFVRYKMKFYCRYTCACIQCDNILLFIRARIDSRRSVRFTHGFRDILNNFCIPTLPFFPTRIELGLARKPYINRTKSPFSFVLWSTRCYYVYVIPNPFSGPVKVLRKHKEDAFVLSS